MAANPSIGNLNLGMSAQQTVSETLRADAHAPAPTDRNPVARSLRGR